MRNSQTDIFEENALIGEMKMNIFDLHCDTVTRAHDRGLELDNEILNIKVTDKIDGKYCQCFAIFCPDELRGESAYQYYCDNRDFFYSQMNKFENRITPVQNKEDISKINDFGKKAGILTVEGGSAIAGSIEKLYSLQNDGVKMMTLTWNGENEIGCGSSNQEFHLKPFGIRVVKEMEKLGMQIDVSHLSDAGFYDVVDNTDCPIVASHSNTRKLCGHRRNLTDDQFKIIVERNGLVGINFYKDFIEDNGDAKVEKLIEHIYHMLELGGEKTICLGSDYDGCDVVKGIENQTSLDFLYEKMLEKGINKETVDDIFWNNAYAFFQKRLK